MSVGIHFEHIVKKYGENVIIPDLNLDVREGEFFTLLGPSGCGKTTPAAHGRGLQLHRGRHHCL